MRRLLNTLYVMQEDSYLSLKNDNVVIHYSDDKKQPIPLLGLEEIICFSYKGASPELIGRCVDQQIGLTFLTPNGRFLARPAGRSNGNVLLRKEQYRISDSEERSCLIARHMIFGKIYNCRWSQERTIRDHSMRVDTDQLRTSSQFLKESCEQALSCDNLNRLRGIEGEAAKMYFGSFDQQILNGKEDFPFRGRNRRPPIDRVNAMLSFGYRLLEQDCASALESVGLDAYVGFMHRDRPGRQSLALDLMEELRPVLVDRQVLTLINTKVMSAKFFSSAEDGAVLFNDKGKRTFLEAWQSHKKEEIRHPYLEEKIPWGLVPYVQAILLARHIRGDIEAYPPFLWK